MHDQLGSTAALLDGSGNVAGTYTYDTYGKVTGTTGTATTPLQYGGGYIDTETGLIYLQARYYDPATGQFLTIDPLLARTRSAYGYVDGNPLNDTDPSGLCPVSSWLCSTGNALKTGARYVVDVAAVAPYALYYGAYKAASGINWLGCKLGSCPAGKIVATPLVAPQAVGLAGDVGYDLIKKYSGLASGQGWDDESRSAQDKRYINPLHGLIPIGPKTYLPGISHRNGCLHIDFACRS